MPRRPTVVSTWPSRTNASRPFPELQPPLKPAARRARLERIARSADRLLPALTTRAGEQTHGAWALLTEEGRARLLVSWPEYAVTPALPACLSGTAFAIVGVDFTDLELGIREELLRRGAHGRVRRFEQRGLRLLLNGGADAAVGASAGTTGLAHASRPRLEIPEHTVLACDDEVPVLPAPVPTVGPTGRLGERHRRRPARARV